MAKKPKNPTPWYPGPQVLDPYLAGAKRAGSAFLAGAGGPGIWDAAANPPAPPVPEWGAGAQVVGNTMTGLSPSAEDLQRYQQYVASQRQPTAPPVQQPPASPYAVAGISPVQQPPVQGTPQIPGMQQSPYSRFEAGDYAGAQQGYAAAGQQAAAREMENVQRQLRLQEQFQQREANRGLPYEAAPIPSPTGFGPANTPAFSPAAQQQMDAIQQGNRPEMQNYNAISGAKDVAIENPNNPARARVGTEGLMPYSSPERLAARNAYLQGVDQRRQEVRAADDALYNQRKAAERSRYEQFMAGREPKPQPQGGPTGGPDREYWKERHQQVRNFRETGNPYQSVADVKKQAKDTLNAYANKTLTDEGKKVYGQLRAEMKALDAARFRPGRQTTSAYQAIFDKVEKSGLDAYVVKAPDLEESWNQYVKTDPKTGEKYQFIPGVEGKPGKWEALGKGTQAEANWWESVPGMSKEVDSGYLGQYKTRQDWHQAVSDRRKQMNENNIDPNKSITWDEANQALEAEYKAGNAYLTGEKGRDYMDIPAPGDPGFAGYGPRTAYLPPALTSPPASGTSTDSASVRPRMAPSNAGSMSAADFWPQPGVSSATAPQPPLPPGFYIDENGVTRQRR